MCVYIPIRLVGIHTTILKSNGWKRTYGKTKLCLSTFLLVLEKVIKMNGIVGVQGRYRPYANDEGLGLFM